MKIKIGYDRIDNACHKLLEEIAGKKLEWNIEPIGEIRDVVGEALEMHGIVLELIDDSICAKAEAGQIPIVAVTKDESEILREDEFGRRI